jgi:uncharacterized protein (TIGR02246 family)
VLSTSADIKQNVSMKTTALFTFLVFSTHLFAQDNTKQDARVEIESFNKRLDAAILKQDNSAVLALWADDGVSLLPSTMPIRGKKEMAKFLDDVTAQTKGWKVIQQQSVCHDVEVSGDWATEWCDTHQVASRPDSQPNWEGWGKTLLVLHREKQGRWLLKREMWNQGVKPN